MEPGDRLRGAGAVLLLGPPGSGKSTVGRALDALPGLVHVSAGEVFRALDRHTARGRRALAYVERGALVPPELAVRVFVEHLRARVTLGSVVPERELLVLDGIPRSAEQAELLRAYVAPRCVLRLEASSEALWGRIRARGRGDDDRATYDARRDRYESTTRPLLDALGERARAVDAAQRPPAVRRDVLAELAPVFDEWIRERRDTTERREDRP